MYAYWNPTQLRPEDQPWQSSPCRREPSTSATPARARRSSSSMACSSTACCGARSCRCSTDFRCIWPDWPLGSHTRADGPDADLSPRGVARLIARVPRGARARGRRRSSATTPAAPSASCSSTDAPSASAGWCSPTATRSRTSRRSCSSPWCRLARVPGGCSTPRCSRCASAPLRRLPIAYGMLTTRRVPDEVTDAWVRPFLTQRAIRRDTVKLLRGVDPAESAGGRRAPGGLRSPGPARLGRRRPRVQAAPTPTGWLTGSPRAGWRRYAGARTFVAEDEPERLARLIADLARGEARATAA